VIQSFVALPGSETLDVTSYESRSSMPTASREGRQGQDPVMEDVQGSQTQTLAMGPVASQEAIKMLGTNGGGFFNANSAHPYENPTPLTNFLQMLAIFLIPAALCFVFGRMVGDTAPGLGRAGGDDADLRRRRGRRHAPSSKATRCCWRAGRRPKRQRHAAGRQHGRQGNALRHRRLRPVRGHHHRRVLRRGERHARQLHAAGRAWCRWC
jgi:hypothetical protein